MSDNAFDTDYPHFMGSEIPQASPTEAFFHVLPVPYEKTVSYGGGTGLGPSAILQASWQLELWDGQSKPGECGIHTCEAIDCSKSAEEVIEAIADSTYNICKSGGMPVILGGEHTVTYGVMKGLRRAGFDDFGIVQVDAHADLRDAYEGDKLSHASVMKRGVDMGIPLLQLGIRAFCEEEAETRKEFGVYHYDADTLVAQNITELVLPENFPKKVFFTLDIDGMDPSVFPSTGTPVPGGLGWYQTLSLFESLCRQREVIGFDVVEFAPIEGFHAYDFAASLLTYKLMGTVLKHRG